MKKTLFLFLAFVMSINIFAQNVDGGATQIMRNLADKYKQYSTIQIQFTLKTEENKKIVQTLVGNMALKGLKYCTSFEGHQLFCDGTSMWDWNKELNEVSIFEFDETDDNALNLLIFIRNWEKSYRPKFIREEFENNKTIQIIDLTPIKAQSYYKIRLIVNKANQEIIRCQLYNKDENNTIFYLYIDKLEVNKPLSDTIFTFNATQHPDVEIIDMR